LFGFCSTTFQKLFDKCRFVEVPSLIWDRRWIH
jgi:hypothetical protein